MGSDPITAEVGEPGQSIGTEVSLLGEVQRCRNHGELNQLVSDTYIKMQQLGEPVDYSALYHDLRAQFDSFRLDND